MTYSLLGFATHSLTNPMSHAAKVQEADAKAEARLLRLLGQEPEWMYQLRYDNGLAWIKQHFGFDPRLENALASMPGPDGAERNLFWSWWLNGWQQLDTLMSTRILVQKSGAATYNDASGAVVMFHTPDDLDYFYRQTHDPKSHAAKLPGFVLEAANRYLRTALPTE